MTTCGQCGRTVAWHWVTGRKHLVAWCYTGASWAGRRHDPWSAGGGYGGKYPVEWKDARARSRNVLGSVATSAFTQDELADVQRILVGA